MKKKKIIYGIIIAVLIIIITLLYSRFIATTGLKVKEYKITNENISEAFHGLKIIHITDIHYGRTVKIKEIKKIVAKINLIKQSDNALDDKWGACPRHPTWYLSNY